MAAKQGHLGRTLPSVKHEWLVKVVAVEQTHEASDQAL